MELTGGLDLTKSNFYKTKRPFNFFTTFFNTLLFNHCLIFCYESIFDYFIIFYYIKRTYNITQSKPYAFAYLRENKKTLDYLKSAISVKFKSINTNINIFLNKLTFYLYLKIFLYI
jgi:hypothetical protein